MTKWLIKIGLKFLSYDALVGVIASAMAYILEYARSKATPVAWDNAKGAVKQIRNWATLFDEVYEDDTLTDEEEKRIQDAIAECTAVTTIYNIITGKKAPEKKRELVNERSSEKKNSSEKKTAKAKKTPAKKPVKKVSTKKKSKKIED